VKKQRNGRGGDRKSISSQHEIDSRKRLKDLGVTYDQTSQYQQMAAIPEEEFEVRLAHAKRDPRTASRRCSSRFHSTRKTRSRSSGSDRIFGRPQTGGCMTRRSVSQSAPCRPCHRPGDCGQASSGISPQRQDISPEAPPGLHVVRFTRIQRLPSGFESFHGNRETAD
jgi:hypothetical protein